MDEKVITELAEDEVGLQGYEWRPKWKSLFHYSIGDKIKDLSLAIEFYKKLNDEQIERRYSIFYWEEAAWGCYNGLMTECQDVFRDSISPSDLAKREIKNVEILLSKGIYQLVLKKDPDLFVNDIPSLYEKLLTSQWDDFIIPGEIDAYEAAYAVEQKVYVRGLKDVFFREKKVTDEVSSKTVCEIKLRVKEFAMQAPRYAEYFNKDWVVSMQIQGLIWYKEFLKQVYKDGVFLFGGCALDWKPQKDGQEQKRLTMNKLVRGNDGYVAIQKSFDDFLEKNNRNPGWPELMEYMANNPPSGFFIVPTYKGKKVIELLIEGVNKPVDRDAFRGRFNRYFKKTDIKSG